MKWERLGYIEARRVRVMMISRYYLLLVRSFVIRTTWFMLTADKRESISLTAITNRSLTKLPADVGS